MKHFDVFGHALHDYLIGNTDAEIILHNTYGAPEQMPVAVFFREKQDLAPLEKKALALCSGTVLDIGAGAGAISVILQEKLTVTALEISSDACEIGKQLGLRHVINGDIWKLQGQTFDTLLMLMNGIGIVGKLRKLTPFLRHLRTLLNPGGQIILDSSDLTYLHAAVRENPELGEIGYQYEYKGNKGGWFNWLYIDEKTLSSIAKDMGFRVEIPYKKRDGHYLAVLTVS